MSATTIHDVGVALSAYLKTNGCPVPVVDGPEKSKRTSYTNEAVVLEHDNNGTDTFSAPRGLHRNAKHRYSATDSYKATLFVQSRVRGAAQFEHRTRAKNVREIVVAGLESVAATNRNQFIPKSGTFITPADLADGDEQNGAAYELKFTYELPIRVVTFAGDAEPEVVITEVDTTANVSDVGQPDDAATLSVTATGA